MPWHIAKVDQSNSKPTDLSQPVLLDAPGSMIRFLTRPNIKKKDKKEIELPGELYSTIRVSRIPVEGDNNRLVSLNEKAGKGTIPAAEFVSINQLTSPKPGFNRFFGAIKMMARLNKSFRINYEMHTMPKNSSLAYCKGAPRQYVLVRVDYMGCTAYILEMDLSDGHGISTLLFRQIDVNKDIKDLVEELLVSYIVKSGSWDKRGLKGLSELRISFAKHTSADELALGIRFKKKIIELNCYAK